MCVCVCIFCEIWEPIVLSEHANYVNYDGPQGKVHSHVDARSYVEWRHVHVTYIGLLLYWEVHEGEVYDLLFYEANYIVNVGSSRW